MFVVVVLCYVGDCDVFGVLMVLAWRWYGICWWMVGWMMDGCCVGWL